jgi:peptide deformylase
MAPAWPRRRSAIDLRVVIFGGMVNPRYPEAPAGAGHRADQSRNLTPLRREEEGWEGCLSVPGLRGWVPRRKRLHYLGFDETGRRFERTAEGFHARVVQHECDHLDGFCTRCGCATSRASGLSRR